MNLPMLAFLLAVAASPQPQLAVIVQADSHEVYGGDEIGNVKVKFSDGHWEMWTRKGHCREPKVSDSGQVGWLKYEMRGYRDEPMFDTVRVVGPDQCHRDFKADGTYPYIEEWGFADNGTAVIIKSRAAHGPADYLKYDLNTGKLVDHAHGLFGDDLPVWARPISD